MFQVFPRKQIFRKIKSVFCLSFSFHIYCRAKVVSVRRGKLFPNNPPKEIFHVQVFQKRWQNLLDIKCEKRQVHASFCLI